MHRVLNAAAVIAIAVSLLVPLVPSGAGQPKASEAGLPSIQVSAGFEALVFPEPLNTSVNVSEYPLVSRALMLDAGAADVKLADLNDDGLTDLVAAVYSKSMIWVFYRQSDGKLPSYPSFNITTRNRPFQIETTDFFGTGTHQIVSLERVAGIESTRVAIYNLTSSTSYVSWPDTAPFGSAVSLVVAQLSADSRPDIAVACAGSDPNSTDGFLYVYFDPSFVSGALMISGLGTSSIDAGDFDDDLKLELAVSNRYDHNVMLFHQPFVFGGVPYDTLNVSGEPVNVIAGKLNADSYDDLAVATQTPNALRFFFQSLGSFPSEEDYNISLPETPGAVFSGLMNADALTDLLVLFQASNTTAGIYQRPTGFPWPDAADFSFPTAGIPRSAVIGDLDEDGLSDIVVASARSDWTGNGLAVYPSRAPDFSNSNSTTWTNSSISTSTIASGDLNGDGVDDLVLLEPGTSSFQYMFSFGGAPKQYLLGFVPDELFVLDLNGDGMAEVVTTSSEGSTVGIVFGNATGPSTDPWGSIQLLCCGNIMDVAVGDFNGDSLTDLLAATDNGYFDFFFNTGSSVPYGAPEQVAITPGSGIWSVAAGDFNSDELLDIAYTRSIRKITILFQQPGQSLNLSSPSVTLSHSVGTDFTSIWSGDLTGDGKTDIAAMRSSDPSIYLFDQNTFANPGRPYATLDLPEVPRFVSIIDATDDGPVDVLAIFDSADLLFLYRQSGGVLPANPSMVFVTGSSPSFAAIGDATHDHRGDLLVNSFGSHAVSAWEQINFPPTVDAGGPYVVMQGDDIPLNATVHTGTSEIPYMVYDWGFGDNTSSGWTHSLRPRHSYTDVRNYTITVEAMDPAGKNATDNATVQVVDSVPHVQFTWYPTDIAEGQNVTLTDATRSFDPVVLRNWSVDGVSAGNGTVIVLELQNGTHMVTLEVTDSDGSVASMTHSIEVNSLPPEVSIVAPSAALEGDPVEFTAVIDAWHGGPVDPISLFEWDFSYVEGNFVPDADASNNAVATKVFSTSSYESLFRVAVRVTDSDGEVNLSTCDIWIFDVGPVLNLTLSDPSPNEGGVLDVVANIVSFDGIVNWSWQLRYPDDHFENLTVRSLDYVELSGLGDGDYTISLAIRETDGNSTDASLGFHVNEVAPAAVLGSIEHPGWPTWYQEFTEITFFVNATSFDPIATYEWDFDALGGEFVADVTTASNTTTHAYGAIGSYTAKARVTDSDGSSVIVSKYVYIAQGWLGGTFDQVVRVSKNVSDTSDIMFDLVVLKTWYPDIIHAEFDFGDGSPKVYTDTPGIAVRHKYDPVADRTVWMNATDDDGYWLNLSFLLRLVPPTIQRLEPAGDPVIRSGNPVLFLIKEGTTPVMNVDYNINGENESKFSTLYRLDTEGWEDGRYIIFMSAMDEARNIVGYNTTIIIDNVSPRVYLFSQQGTKANVFGGDKLNVTVRVDDRNVVASGVTLYVKFPGDRVFLPYSVSQSAFGNFYRILDVPQREGVIELYADVTDLAGNPSTTDVSALTVELHLVYWAWPYMLTAAILAALGTAGYFMRESKIAVDEAFVIYKDGRLIAHSTRRLKPGMDDQVLGSMFVAIQDFVKESFKDITSFTLRRLDFGDKSIVIEKGDHLYLAAVLHGTASKKMASRMRMVVGEIEGTFSKHLDGWDGDLDKLRGVSDIVTKLYSRLPMMPGSLRKEE